MLHTATNAIGEERHHHYRVGLARGPEEILEAQRLRYRVFAEEMGARLPSRALGIDLDLYDAHCDHLVAYDDAADRVVGTYRILPPHAAKRVGGYYTESEFDISRLRHLRPDLVEVGRSCIDPEYRNGAVIALLWSKLAEYMARGGYGHLMGCASIGMGDGGHNAANIFVQAIDGHMGPPEYRVFPRHRLPFERLVTGHKAEVPALVKGYLRAGAYVCGEPAWDPDFNTADLMLMLPMNRISRRYVRHFVDRLPHGAA
ncbi:MAG TPA: GNAT family N-acyltransferase [Rhodocyclaceae bacterium]|nr:GNAT family N-acyltransferase [Rhodocyclaceae bacterium]HNH35992.1 GNAT family N-acyltransferase [Rhodocyclaceae bacterium]